MRKVMKMQRTDPLGMLVTLLLMPPILFSIGAYLSIVSKPGGTPSHPQFHGTVFSLLFVVPAFFVVYAGGVVSYSALNAKYVQFTQVILGLVMAFLLPRSDAVSTFTKRVCVSVLLLAIGLGTVSLVLSLLEWAEWILGVSSVLTLLAPTLPFLTSSSSRQSWGSRLRPVNRAAMPPVYLLAVSMGAILIGLLVIVFKQSG
jgi:hypothetical protein